MRKCFLYIALAATPMLGCSKPDKIELVKSPRSEIFYTIETTDGDGPMSSGSTDVYAHLLVNGKSQKSLVLHGLYLEVSKVLWNSPSDVSLCVPSGLTSTYHNVVSLNVGKTYVTIQNHLVDHECR